MWDIYRRHSRYQIQMEKSIFKMMFETYFSRSLHASDSDITFTYFVTPYIFSIVIPKFHLYILWSRSTINCSNWISSTAVIPFVSSAGLIVINEIKRRIVLTQSTQRLASCVHEKFLQRGQPWRKGYNARLCIIHFLYSTTLCTRIPEEVPRVQETKACNWR